MEIFDHKTALGAYLDTIRSLGQRIALVPTMGALHEGHISLIQKARELADVVVCSVFVNPTQFNDPSDLEKYPRTEEQDKAMLETAGCHVVFMPSVAEMYGQPEHWHLDMDKLDTVLEGALRPGHYQGVTQIVKKLIDIVNPQWALFGQKDYQQLLVIRYMARQLALDTEIVMCPTVRDANGLAMSSRNVRLSVHGKQEALALYRILKWVKDQGKIQQPKELQAAALEQLQGSAGVEPEYFVICNGETLEELQGWPAGNNQPTIALVAARVEGVRLIDNMLL